MATTPSDDDDRPRRLHPITPFYRLLSFLPRLVLPAVAALFAGGDRTQLLFVLPIAIGTLYGGLAYLRFTYRIERGAIVVDEGVFTRKQRVVRLDRIQQVDVVAKVLHRVLGVASVKLDTASGGHGADVELTVVSTDEAERLRALVASQRTTPAPPSRSTPDSLPDSAPDEPDAARDDDVLVAIPTSELALAGVTGGRLLVLLTVLGPLSEVFDEVPESIFDSIGAAAAQRSAVALAIVLGVLFLVVWFGAAAGGSVLSYGGYTLVRRGGDLRLSSGLLERREASIPIDRVQAIRISENIVRRALGRVSVRIQSGAVTGTKTHVVVPILRASDLDALVAAVLPGTGAMPALERAPRAARRRAILRRVVPTTALAVAAMAARPHVLVVIAAVVAVAVAISAGELHYRALGIGATPSLVVGRAGGLARSTTIVPAAKAQATVLRTSPLQRRAGLATLVLPVAGSGDAPRLRDQDAGRARAAARGVIPAMPADERHERERVRRRRLAPASQEPVAG